jgi:ABC-type dipeptide/oligopeptide/nickel transport system permease component
MEIFLYRSFIEVSDFFGYNVHKTFDIVLLCLINILASGLALLVMHSTWENKNLDHIMQHMLWIIMEAFHIYNLPYLVV